MEHFLAEHRDEPKRAGERKRRSVSLMWGTRSTKYSQSRFKTDEPNRSRQDVTSTTYVRLTWYLGHAFYFWFLAVGGSICGFRHPV